MNSNQRLVWIIIVLFLIGIFMNSIGIRLNQFVRASNNGYMPINDWNGYADNYFGFPYINASNNTRFNYFADNQNLAGLSLGDIIGFISVIPEILAIFLLLHNFAKDKQTEKENKK